MLKLADRVKQTSLTEGTGSITFNGTFGSFQLFSVIGNGNTTYYTIENGSNFEVGIGTYTSASNSLSRDLVLESSNNNQKINLVGLSIVFCTYPADHSVFLNEKGYISGQMPFYSGIVFPDNSIQSTALYGSGSANKIAYWSNNNSLTYSNNLSWSNNYLYVNGSGNFTSNLVVGGNLTVGGSTVSSGSAISNSTISSSTFFDNIFYRTSAGCFFHAYVDNAYDNMVALYSTNEQNPTWLLGLKTYSTSFISPPDVGYISGNNGAIGIYATDQNGAILNYTNGFWVKHRNLDIFNADKNNGVTVYNATSTKDALSVVGAAGQSANLQTWENYTSTILASIDATGQLYCQNVKFGDNSVQTRAYSENYRNISSSANILSTDDVVFVDCSSGNINLTLPSAISLGGKKIHIKRKTGSFGLTILTSLSQTIDGSNSFSVFSNYQAITLVSDNSNWFII
jgi:hypothetical protein